MTSQREQIIRRFRKVAFGRLYWRRSNPRMRRFDSDDVAIVINGVVSTHYKTLAALIADIEEAEASEPPTRTQGHAP